MIIVKVCHCKSCVEHGAADIANMFGRALNDNGTPNAAFVIPNIQMTACDRDGVTIEAGTAKYNGVTPAGFEGFFKETMVPQLGGQ